MERAGGQKQKANLTKLAFLSIPANLLTSRELLPLGTLFPLRAKQATLFLGYYTLLMQSESIGFISTCSFSIFDLGRSSICRGRVLKGILNCLIEYPPFVSGKFNYAKWHLIAVNTSCILVVRIGIIICTLTCLFLCFCVSLRYFCVLSII